MRHGSDVHCRQRGPHQKGVCAEVHLPADAHHVLADQYADFAYSAGGCCADFRPFAEQNLPAAAVPADLPGAFLPRTRHAARVGDGFLPRYPVSLGRFNYHLDVSDPDFLPDYGSSGQHSGNRQAQSAVLFRDLPALVRHRWSLA